MYRYYIEIRPDAWQESWRINHNLTHIMEVIDVEKGTLDDYLGIIIPKDNQRFLLKKNGNMQYEGISMVFVKQLWREETGD